MRLPLLVSLIVSWTYAAWGASFDYETIQLTEADVNAFPDVSFGRISPETSENPHPECRAFPATVDWPTPEQWDQLNATINGNLLKPIPLAAACYPGHAHYNAATCRNLLGGGGFSRVYMDDPIAVLTQWPEGNTCLAAWNPRGNCTQGGFPTYVVRATNVRHVQAVINFARNRNLRLVIKNTGHDFGGRSVGAGALSLWTHFLKDFEYLPEFTIGTYTGMAVRIGAGLEASELFNYMATYGITVVAPGDGTVGLAGGWFSGGGHGTLTSLYGLGADQVLSIRVVTADGRHVTASPSENEDLFFAIRGGGGGTFGVVTSIVMKAYPPISVTTSSINFGIYNGPAANASSSGNGTTRGPFARTGSISDPETFWSGVGTYYRFARKIVDAGGIGFSYIYPRLNNSFSFTTSSSFPGRTPAEVVTFLQPLYDELNSLGINITVPRRLFASPYGSRRPATGDRPANTRYRSRFFPRANWDSDALFAATTLAIRRSVEAGRTFHGILHGPSEAVAGWPGRTAAINPAWRRAVMHGSLVGREPEGMSPQQATSEQIVVQNLVEAWREVTPGSGAYMNEGDPGEPEWQKSFFGDNYPRLLEIKRARDPWGLFWAPTTVGSEAWEVRAVDGYPWSQNGRLCRSS